MRLRGHHLICLHYYHGEGYDQDYRSLLRELMARAAACEPVQVVAGVDDVCWFCPDRSGDTCRHAPGAEAETRALDATALALLGVETGATLAWHDLEVLIAALAPDQLRGFCRGCSWSRLCRAGG